MYGENYVSLGESNGWVVRLWRRYRPSTGWGVFLLALTAVLLLPAGMIDSELILGLGPAVSLSIAAFIFTWWLAHRRISGPWAAVAVLAAGVLADLVWGVFVLRPAALAPQLARWWSWALGERIAPAPSLSYFREQGAALAGYFDRVTVWGRGLILGPGSPDNLAAIGAIVILAWLIAAWAAWWVARRHEPFIAVLPTGIFLAQQAYWAPDVISYALLFLGVTVFLIVFARLTDHTRQWDAEGVDYAEDIRIDAVLAGLALTLIVTFVSPTLPFVASPEFSQKFWTFFESPWRRVENQVSASFQVARPVRSLVPPAGAEPGGLPRAHLLGGRPELRQTVALRVRVRGDPGNLQLYWRGHTYARYTGRGWENGVGESQILDLQAGQPWAGGLPPVEGRRPVLAAVESVGASRAVLYAPGEPVSVDRPYQAVLRAADDVVALSAPGGSGEYTALSHVPEQDAGRLRAAGAAYPSNVAALHLQLPEGLDPRLLALAHTLTSNAATPFDAALAIEQELRRIPYSLDLPTPPESRELVSWFLFDLERGYCDYYASAMVVLARLSGIPARLAIGYATGDFDETTGQYTVSELSAHSWPELYFPGIGWVPFEPTAYQPAPPRIEGVATPSQPPAFPPGPDDLTAGLAEIQASAQERAVVERRAATTRGLSAVVSGLALVWVVWLFWLNVRLVPYGSGEAVRAFERFARWGRRLGRPFTPSETLRQYVAGVATAAERISARSARRDAQRSAQVVRAEGVALARDVERSLYGPEAERKPWNSRDALWAALRHLWFASKLGKRRRSRLTRG